MRDKKRETSIRLGVFDLDGTLLSKSLPFLFGKWLFLKGHLPFRGFLTFLKLILFYRLLSSRKELFQERVVSLLETYFPDRRLEALSRQFLSKALPLLLNQKVFRYLKKLQKAKVKTLLLSSSPDFLVRVVAKKLKISDWKGVTYRKGSALLLDGIRKKEFLERYLKQVGIHPSQVLAMADSLLDLPLLSAVGLPIVVNPTKDLKRISELKNWRVLT